MEKTEKYEVEGFLFETKEEAELARKEADAIRYLKKMNNMKNPKVMYQVYEKMISQKLFDYANRQRIFEKFTKTASWQI